MKRPVPFFKAKMAVLMLLITCGLHAQLPDFTLQATPVAQTCLGNGTINFSVSGNSPSAAIAYEVFLLPNTTIPVAAVSTLSAGNLVAGDYLIVATQTIGSQSNTATATVTIPDETVPLAYSVVPAAACNGNGSLIINVTSGTAVSYEIMSGPVTFPQQASNTFSSLPPGQYTVRVYDICGDAVVQTVQVFHEEPADLDIFDGGLVELAGCDMVNVKNQFVAINGNDIAWPLTFEYTVYPPGGGVPVVITSVVPVLDSEGGLYSITSEIPFYYGEEYSYSLEVTDACGNVYLADAEINIDITGNWELRVLYNPCFPSTLNFHDFSNISFPVTITFLDAPVGFDPSEYNSQHPVFENDDITYTKAGDLLPIGNYSIMLTDACGRSSIRDVIVSGANDGIHLEEYPGECGFGGIRICMAFTTGSILEIIAGPSQLSDIYPVQIIGDSVLENGDIALSHLPEGDYTIHIINACDQEFFFDSHVTSTPVNVSVLQAPGCAEGYGSVNVSFEDALNTVTITSAPEGFAGMLPFDASANIDENGIFFMNTLPEGAYTITTTTEDCPNAITTQFSVTGYHTVYDDVTVIPNCGSFNLKLRQVANNNFAQYFWLQKYDEATDTWGHPATGVQYTEGTVPTEDNAQPLSYTAMNYNLAYTGQFRVIRVFDVFGNGTASSSCIAVIEEFTVEDGPQILNAYSFPCDNGTAEVLIEAEGLPPLSYAITQKNGQPFTVNNGASPFFTALEPAIYNFMVTDVCGNIRNIIFDINTLEPMEIEAQGFCEGQDSSLIVPDFPFLAYQWYKEGSPATILGTTNKLDFPAFDPDTEIGTYLVHIVATTPGSCIDLTIAYEIIPNALPDAGNDNSISMCGGGEAIDLSDYLGTPHDAGGMWADTNGTGMLTNSVLTVSGLSQGTYQFTYTVTSACGIEDVATINVQIQSIPEAPAVAPVAPVCEGTDVQLSATAVPGAVYAWTGPGGYTSAEQNPLLDNTVVADAGTYSLTVTVNGCASPASTVDVVVNPVPQFIIDGNATICGGQSTVLSVAPANFTTDGAVFTWHKDGELLTDVTDGDVEVFEAGIYDVTVDKNGCSFSQQIEVILNNNAFTVDLEAGCLDYNYVISIVNINEIPGASFSWSGPDGYSSTGEAADITNLPGGEYFVTVTNGEGCSADASIMVDNTNCFIPRGISPNDDQYNNSFDLSNLNVKDITIFNRYGLKVYEKENYKNEWYGQSDKGELPTGTYFYVVTLSEGKQVTGWVYLQREVN